MKEINFLLLAALVSCGSRMEKPVAPIDAKNFAYKQCFYESESFRNTKVGQVVVGFKVLPDGKIEDEKILKTDFKDANFHACLLEMTRELKIPPAKDGADKKITKVINFSSKLKMNE